MILRVKNLGRCSFESRSLYGWLLDIQVPDQIPLSQSSYLITTPAPPTASRLPTVWFAHSLVSSVSPSRLKILSRILPYLTYAFVHLFTICLTPVDYKPPLPVLPVSLEPNIGDYLLSECFHPLIHPIVLISQ